jgi:hypothetical protein
MSASGAYMIGTRKSNVICTIDNEAIFTNNQLAV